MKENRYTLEAWERAYDAVIESIKWQKSDWIDGEYKEYGKTEFTEDEKLRLKCFEDVLKAIEKMA